MSCTNCHGDITSWREFVVWYLLHIDPCISCNKKVKASPVIYNSESLDCFEVSVHDMYIRQPIDLEIRHQPFFNIEFWEGSAGTSERLLHVEWTQIVMQVSNPIIFNLTKSGQYFIDIFFNCDEAIDIGIWMQRWSVRFLYQIVDLCTELLFETTDDGSREYNVSDGGEADDQNFFASGHLKIKGKALKEGVKSGKSRKWRKLVKPEFQIADLGLPIPKSLPWLLPFPCSLYWTPGPCNITSGHTTRSKSTLQGRPKLDFGFPSP